MAKLIFGLRRITFAETIALDYSVLKSLHIIFIVTWFSGLFYAFRLFVYIAEANISDEPGRSLLRNQFHLMLKRLWYIITWPSALLTLLFGIWLLMVNPFDLISQGYMQMKLGFVALLIAFQCYGQRLLNQSIANKVTLVSFRIRLLNEVPTIILIACVFLIVQKNAFDWVKGLMGIMGVAILLALSAKVYKYYREKKSNAGNR